MSPVNPTAEQLAHAYRHNGKRILDGDGDERELTEAEQARARRYLARAAKHRAWAEQQQQQNNQQGG